MTVISISETTPFDTILLTTQLREIAPSLDGLNSPCMRNEQDEPYGVRAIFFLPDETENHPDIDAFNDAMVNHNSIAVTASKQSILADDNDFSSVMPTLPYQGMIGVRSWRLVSTGLYAQMSDEQVNSVNFPVDFSTDIPGVYIIEFYVPTGHTGYARIEAIDET